MARGDVIIFKELYFLYYLKLKFTRIYYTKNIINKGREKIMAFIIYEHVDYKLVIKERLKDLKKERAKFTLQHAAEVLDIQYTFLSKVLNSDVHQLNEDQIFSLGRGLEFLDDEIEYFLLLRSHQATTNKIRKKLLQQKISGLQTRHNLSSTMSSSAPSQYEDDMRYLMDYQVPIVHVAMGIPAIQKNPRILMTLLKLEEARLKEILFLLDRMGWIELDIKSNVVKSLLNPRSHFGKDHPLTRTHQLLMKTALNQISLSKKESEKENLFFSFTTDDQGFEKIKKQIKLFISDVQKITFDHKHTGVYQLNLDLIEVFQI